MTPTLRSKKDLGDFQTPPALVSQILETLERVGGRPSRVLEPTCGRGHFLAELLDGPDSPVEMIGCEIQPEYAETARSLDDGRLTVRTVDLFQVDLRRDLPWRSGGPLLVVGNLPWVTTSALGASGGSNGPIRSNVKGLPGVAARTGESNFDISEAIWLKLIRELAHESPTIALLCKTAVARNVLRAIHPDGLQITRATLWRVDARRWFRASVDACLLRVEVGPGPRATEAMVYEGLASPQPESTLGLAEARLIADARTYPGVRFADGPSPLDWRQGVKHDAGSIMELTFRDDGRLVNKLGETVDVEADHVYPLQKGTDLGGTTRTPPRRSVLLPQRRLGDDTRLLESTAPRLWAYLGRHAPAFERRKSSIYRGRPPFSLFGVGDYSFAPYKVAISGLHKNPRFRLVSPVDGRPTMLDDTCYFLPCRTFEQASLLVETLNGPVALGLVRSLAFPDAKRPVTKALLQRVDLKAILAHSGRAHLWLDGWESDWTRPNRSPATPPRA